MKRHELFGLPLDEVKLADAAEWVRARALETGPPMLVHTVNVDHFVLARRDPEFMRVSQEVALSVADGMPVVWAARLFSMPLPERVAGVDLFESIGTASGAPIPTYLFGARAEVAARAAQILRDSAPGIEIVGRVSPSPEELQDAEWNAKACDAINRSGARILALALGAPKQELWFDRHAHLLTVRIAIGLGGTLDFVAGTTKRAPVWMQRLGLEWAHRLAHEPRRLARRYLVNDTAFLGWVASGVVKTAATRFLDGWFWKRR